MDGYLKIEGEEIPMEASRMKSFKKHMGIIVEKAVMLMTFYPYYSALFALGIIAFVCLSFYCTDYILDKLEKRHEKDEKIKKKT